MADSQFTSTALGAIRLAQENAARLGHSYVGSEHLLLGLAGQEFSPAALALAMASLEAAVMVPSGVSRVPSRSNEISFIIRKTDLLFDRPAEPLRRHSPSAMRWRTRPTWSCSSP